MRIKILLVVCAIISCAPWIDIARADEVDPIIGRLKADFQTPVYFILSDNDILLKKDSRNIDGLTGALINRSTPIDPNRLIGIPKYMSYTYLPDKWQFYFVGNVAYRLIGTGVTPLTVNNLRQDLSAYKPLPALINLAVNRFHSDGWWHVYDLGRFVVTKVEKINEFNGTDQRTGASTTFRSYKMTVDFEASPALQTLSGFSVLGTAVAIFLVEKNPVNLQWQFARYDTVSWLNTPTPTSGPDIGATDRVPQPSGGLTAPSAQLPSVTSFPHTQAFAGCEAYSFPEAPVDKTSTSDQLLAIGAKLQGANQKLLQYSSCINKLQKLPLTPGEDSATRQARISSNTQAYSTALNNLNAAAAEYNAAVAYQRSASPGHTNQGSSSQSSSTQSSASAPASSSGALSGNSISAVDTFTCISDNKKVTVNFFVDHDARTVMSPTFGQRGAYLNAEISDTLISWHEQENTMTQDMSLDRSTGRLTDKYGSQGIFGRRGGVQYFNCRSTSPTRSASTGASSMFVTVAKPSAPPLEPDVGGVRGKIVLQLVSGKQLQLTAYSNGQYEGSTETKLARYQCPELILRYANSIGLTAITSGDLGDARNVAINLADSSGGKFEFVSDGSSPNLPSLGAVLSVRGFKGDEYGHVGIVQTETDGADGTYKITLFDQNFPDQIPEPHWTIITFKKENGTWHGTMRNSTKANGVQIVPVSGWANPVVMKGTNG